MGFSQVYAGFAGLAEVLAGLLLLSRRTTSLGALMAVAVMANVAIMNSCFDVPVKLHSSMFLLMAVYLVVPELRRFADVFIHNRRVEPVDLGAPVLGRRLRIARLVAKGGFLLSVVWFAGGLLTAYLGRGGERPALYGAWEVEHFEIGGADRGRGGRDPAAADRHRGAGQGSSPSPLEVPFAGGAP